MAMTIDDLNNAIDGRSIIRRRGVEVPLRLTAAQKQEYQQTIARGWCVGAKGSSKVGASVETAYEMYCNVTDSPIVIVRHKVKYSSVFLDMICSSHQLSEAATLLVRDAYQRVRVKEYKGMPLQYGSICALNDGIPRHLAEGLAAEIAVIVHDKTNWQPYGRHEL